MDQTRKNGVLKHHLSIAIVIIFVFFVGSTAITYLNTNQTTVVAIALLFFLLLSIYLSILLSKMRSNESSLRDSSHLNALVSRGALSALAQTLINLNTRFEQRLCFLLAGVDDLEQIRDEHGLETSNQVLRIVYESFTNNFRETDIVSRYDDSKFLIILPNTGKDEGYRLAESIRSQVEGLDAEGLSIEGIRISIGSIELRKNEIYDDVIQRVSNALLCAKQGGQNRTVVA